MLIITVCGGSSAYVHSNPCQLPEDNRMISAVAWVRRGVPKELPKTEADIEESEQDGEQDAAPDSGEPSGSGSGVDSGKRRALEADTDSEDDDGVPGALRGENLMYYRDNGSDPYITAPADLSDDSEIDDFAIGATDLVLLGARSDENLSNLEVYVYEEPQDNLYAHHDIPLPVFPLCLAWLDFYRGLEGRGNFVAIGTFAPYIEVWDLDVIDALEPLAVLGAEGAEASSARSSSSAAEALASQGKRGKQQKKKKKGTGQAALEGHTDAVMALSWNAVQRNVLASASADNSIRLWDLGGGGEGSVQAFHHHADKVQALQWHPTEAPVFVSGSFDQTAAVTDVRAPDATRSFTLGADAEKVCWDMHTGHSFYVTTEDGVLRCFDVRKAATASADPAAALLWQVKAHSVAASGLDVCPGAPNIIATGSQERKQ